MIQRDTPCTITHEVRRHKHTSEENYKIQRTRLTQKQVKSNTCIQNKRFRRQSSTISWAFSRDSLLPCKNMSCHRHQQGLNMFSDNIRNTFVEIIKMFCFPSCESHVLNGHIQKKGGNEPLNEPGVYYLLKCPLVILRTEGTGLYSKHSSIKLTNGDLSQQC